MLYVCIRESDTMSHSVCSYVYTFRGERKISVGNTQRSRESCSILPYSFYKVEFDWTSWHDIQILDTFCTIPNIKITRKFHITVFTFTCIELPNTSLNSVWNVI